MRRSLSEVRTGGFSPSQARCTDVSEAASDGMDDDNVMNTELRKLVSRNAYRSENKSLSAHIDREPLTVRHSHSTLLARTVRKACGVSRFHSRT